jgi:MFS superfamily sulfate permease-like transporter
VPWAVLLAIAGILVGAAVEGTKPPLFQTIKSRYENLYIQLVAVFDSSTVPPLNVDTVSDLFRGSVSIAAVAVLETLISARIADRMTKTIFDQPREVLSVGLANLASGFTGGIPATAALARTALNVKTGATSRGSGIVSAVMIMLLSSVLFSAFQYLPLPVVATILVNTAYRMVEWHEIHLLYDTDRPMMVVCVVTAIICAVQDPTMGIVYGTGFSMIRVLLALMHGHSHLYVFQGTLIELSTEFKINNGSDSVPTVRRRFLKEVDPVEVEKEKQRLKAAEAVTSSANAIAAAASALRIAEEDSRHTAAALVAAASGKASSMKTRKALTATMTAGGGADALAASAAAAAIASNDEEPEFLKGVPAAPEDARLPKVAVYEMPGYCTYVGAKSHLDRIRGLFVNKATCLPGIDVVAFSMEECKYADPDALEAMGDVVDVRGAAPKNNDPHPLPAHNLTHQSLPRPQEMSRERKTVFLLGLSPVMQRLVAKVPWSASVVNFEDYPSLLLNMREALRLDEERHTLGGGSSDGMGVPTLAEMVVRRVRDITLTGGGAAGSVSASGGDVEPLATPRAAAAQPNAGGAASEGKPRGDEWT